VAQEPGRADYLRDLSVSYNKMGDLQRALGEGEAARQFYEKSLELRERLVAQEPGRADYRVDLAKSLARIGDADHLQRALDIVHELQRSQRLSKADEQIIPAIQRLLNEAKRAGA
jgi:tetratricopeptide (TPR) repeat protein